MCKLIDKEKPSIQQPWRKFYSEEALADTFTHKTIYRYLRDCNANNGETYALNYFGNRIKYASVLDNIEKAASAFKALGIGEGDIVPCCSVTTPEMIYSLYALNKLGAAPLMIDPRTAADGVGSFIDESGSDTFVVLDLAYEHLAKMLESRKLKNVIVISADTSMPLGVRLLKQLKVSAPQIAETEVIRSWKSFIAQGRGIQTEEAAFDAKRPAAITLTGGTTGAPKGVMLSNDGFNAIAFDFKHCGVAYTAGTKFMNIIPMFASYGIVSSLHMPLSLGLELIVIPKFDAEKVGHYIKKYRPEHTLLVPAHYEKLMNSKEMARGFDLSFFVTAGSGGDTMNAGLEAKLNGFLAEHGCKYPLSQGYGMSEVSSAATCCCNGNFKSLSVGYPLLTTEVAVFRPGTTEECDYNEEGEICITGPSIMLGYMNRPEETANTMWEHPDGKVWVHSGDIGCIDEDGFVFIKGRIKRMITRFDGHKVFPTHIESVMGGHADVQSCAVVGVTDRDHAQGMLPLAVVELRKSCEREQSAIRLELEKLCEKELEERGRPFKICFVSDMPRKGMDKIDYIKLAEDYENNEQSRTKAG